MSRWTKGQYAVAMQQVEDTDALDGFLDYSEPEVVDAILEIACQRNDLLEALRNARIVLGEAGSAEHVKQLTDTELGRLWIVVTEAADGAIARAEAQ